MAIARFSYPENPMEVFVHRLCELVIRPNVAILDRSGPSGISRGIAQPIERSIHAV